MSLRNLRNLPSLADLQRTRRATPKGATRLEQKTAAKATAAQQEAAFRADVWKRDGSRCRCCHRRVVHTVALTAARGDVHHVHGRMKALRYEPKAALLVCAHCHEQITGTIGRRLFVSATKTFDVNGKRYTDCSAPVVFREAAQ